jgi:hypothetical protein
VKRRPRPAMNRPPGASEKAYFTYLRAKINPGFVL